MLFDSHLAILLVKRHLPYQVTIQSMNSEIKNQLKKDFRLHVERHRQYFMRWMSDVYGWIVSGHIPQEECCSTNSS